jgi:hypothetical protein
MRKIRKSVNRRWHGEPGGKSGKVSIEDGMLNQEENQEKC